MLAIELRFSIKNLEELIARVAELVDALDSKSSVSNNVPVRPRPRVLKPTRFLVGFLFTQKSPLTAHSLSPIVVTLIIE